MTRLPLLFVAAVLPLTGWSQTTAETADNAELKRVMKKVQAEALAEFEQFLDIQVDSRLVELMDIARRELIESEKQKQKQQRRRTPQLLAVK